MPHNLTICEGDMARFYCQVYSQPEASIVWRFNGEPIQSDNVYQVCVEKDGRSWLVIDEALSEDSGVYSVHAVNDLGEATSSALLMVEGTSMLHVCI